MYSKYLAQYAEPEARNHLATTGGRQFEHCIVIPAYREAIALADKIRLLTRRYPGLLVILVVNQPDCDRSDDANRKLKSALKQTSQLLVLERSTPLPAKEGVGLARKIGCDVALALMHSGAVVPGWIHCTDADATLPDGYFTAAETPGPDFGVIAHPFQHRLQADQQLAMILYELRLHDYVLGLRRAGSVYAFHTLGSCISIRHDIYEKVRGFPRRAGAEDFYLLNKAAKVTQISTPTEPQIKIDGRISDRVPFGTGPALTRLAASDTPGEEPLFYHPESFAALRKVLAAVERQSSLQDVFAIAPQAHSVLASMGVDKALQHCRTHSNNQAGFARHFHQWLDGFRTLKFIHGMRERGYVDQSFTDISDGASPAEKLADYRKQLGWVLQAGLESNSTPG